MKDEEKQLIENLFDRLKSTELNSSERDDPADELIQKLVKKQPSSSYYMVQTILVQETAIKKMNEKMQKLEKILENNKLKKSEKNTSFLSNLFTKDSDSRTASSDSNIWKKKDSFAPSPYNYNAAVPFPNSSTVSPNQNVMNNSSGSFLKNALQTATGVAGGMILGNMLMNIFNHSKPEEEIFDTIKTHALDNEVNDYHNNDSEGVSNDHLINYEEDDVNEDPLDNDILESDEEYNPDDDNFI